MGGVERSQETGSWLSMALTFVIGVLVGILIGGLLSWQAIGRHFQEELNGLRGQLAAKARSVKAARETIENIKRAIAG